MEMPNDLLQKWDDLRRAIGVMQTAQPAQMTAAATRLEEAKNAFEAELTEVSLNDTSQFPIARDVARLEDMSPDGHLRVLLDNDNDVLVEVFDGTHFASVEFCSPGAGGGQSSQTRLALIGVMNAILADNEARPGRVHPRFK